MLLFTNTHHTISGREGHARVVDDDLQTSIGSPAVLERVLDLRLAPVGAREVVLAHRGRGIGEEQGLLVVEAHGRPRRDREALVLGHGLVGTGRTLCGNQPVRRARQFFTKSFLGDDAAVLARSSGEEFTPPRRRAGVASERAVKF